MLRLVSQNQSTWFHSLPEDYIPDFMPMRILLCSRVLSANIKFCIDKHYALPSYFWGYKGWVLAQVEIGGVWEMALSPRVADFVDQTGEQWLGLWRYSITSNLSIKATALRACSSLWEYRFVQLIQNDMKGKVFGVATITQTYFSPTYHLVVAFPSYTAPI